MRILFIILSLLLLTCANNSQQISQKDKLKIVFDTSHKNRIGNYSSTDFSEPGDLNMWFYKIDTLLILSETDSIKALGELTFTKSHSSKRSMTFSIYNLSDSSFCYTKSSGIQLLSSCVAPDVGGDIVIIGKYMLLNEDACLNCSVNPYKKDECRPSINAILSKVDGNKLTDIKSLIDQLAIKATL